jgi:hypothetical protein
MASVVPHDGLIAVAFTLSALPAYACSCEGGNPSSCQVLVADIIVRATVVSIENQTRPPFSRPAPDGGPQLIARPAGAILPPEPWGRVRVTLSVSERFRGVAGDRLVVRTGLGERRRVSLRSWA